MNGFVFELQIFMCLMGKVYIDDCSLRPCTTASNFPLVSKAKLEIQFPEKIIYMHMGPQILTVISMLKVVFKYA